MSNTLDNIYFLLKKKASRWNNSQEQVDDNEQ
jgi:hypothetical protein